MVYLIGAGPGNPGLITARGLEILKRCDALVYDRLGTNELLEVVPKDCEKVYVGKKPGEHYKRQEEINNILVEMAKKHKSVVRLKGGDPFVFGRGGEEVIVLKENSIPFQIIPGITSAISVPELMGIPVTHRQTSRSFHVYTGHTKDETTGFDYIQKQEGTSVFLMGIANLGNIVKKLIQDGQKENTPVAVISNGTLPGEKMVKGTLLDIETKIKEEKLSSPAIVVIGETTDYSFISNDVSSIAGLKLGVVGSSLIREKMRLMVEEKGASLFSVLSMEIEKAKEYDLLDQAFVNLDAYSYIVFTSGNSIKLFFEKAKKAHFDFRQFSKVKFAVVGSGTKATLREYGFEADYMPELYTTKALAQGLSSRLTKDDKLLIPRALMGSEEMLLEFDNNGISYQVLSIYDVVGKKTDNWEFLNKFDVITFESGSGVREFVTKLKEDVDVLDWEKARQASGPRIAAIGKVTADELTKYGIRADIIPLQCDLVNLIHAIEKYYEIRE